MTETIDATEVAATVTSIENAPSRRKTVIGRAARAALEERYAQADAAGDIVFELDGKEFRVRNPLPAAAIVAATSFNAGDELDLNRFVEAIVEAVHPDDGVDFRQSLLRTDVEKPVDLDFLGELLGEIVEAVTGRPTSK